jgi:hypothetical protein
MGCRNEHREQNLKSVLFIFLLFLLSACFQGNPGLQHNSSGRTAFYDEPALTGFTDNHQAITDPGHFTTSQKIYLSPFPQYKNLVLFSIKNKLLDYSRMSALVLSETRKIRLSFETLLPRIPHNYPPSGENRDLPDLS